jgi:hypothetical protein
MTDHGIFKYIWRINAILVLVAGIGFSYLLVDEFVDYLNDRFAPRDTSPVAKDMTLRLGSSMLVGNGKFYLMPYSPGGRWKGEGAWVSEPIRNFLIVDAETNESRWMFPDGDRRIIKWREITKDIECGYESVGVEIIEVPVDSNDDGNLNQWDMTRRLVSAGFRHEPRDLVGEPVSSFTCEENDGRLFCQFRTRQGRESAVFALDGDMTLIDRRALPSAPTGRQEGGDG